MLIVHHHQLRTPEHQGKHPPPTCSSPADSQTSQSEPPGAAGPRTPHSPMKFAPFHIMHPAHGIRPRFFLTHRHFRSARLPSCCCTEIFVHVPHCLPKQIHRQALAHAIAPHEMKRDDL